jgi:hypothetical protein
LQGEGIRFGGKPLGRPMKQTAQNAGQIKLEKKLRKKDALERIPIEGKFGQGKNGYRLNYIRARTAATSESWIRAIFLVMNLMVLLRCWCGFCFGAMKTKILQFWDDQITLIRFGLDIVLGSGHIQLMPR